MDDDEVHQHRLVTTVALTVLCAAVRVIICQTEHARSTQALRVIRKRKRKLAKMMMT